MTKLLRWLFPILSGLALGIIAGLVYTWLIEPVHYTDTAPDRLRADAKPRRAASLSSETFQ